MLKYTQTLKHVSSRAAALLLVATVLGACAYQRPTDLNPPLLHDAGPIVQVDEVDVLALSAEMEDFLERYILIYPDKHTRLTLLMNAASGNGMLGFDYDDTLTLTAKEAFEARAGNCIGFANMMVALSRAAGLKASYQEVFRQPQWLSREDTVLLVKHINVVLESAGYTYVMDVSGLQISSSVRRRLINDDYAKALYLNNIGAEALIKNDLPTAYAYMSEAIRIEPMLTDSWVNLGVVLGRNEQLDDAATAFRNALGIDNFEYSAMSNLYEIYISQEDFEAAEELEGKVERYRQKNPYYLLQLSEEALLESRLNESQELLERAIKKKDNDHLLHFAMARTQYLAGQTQAAQFSMLRARELAPENMLARYNRPLGELVAEHQAKVLEELLQE